MKLLALSAFACIAFGAAAMACPDYNEFGSTYTFSAADLLEPKAFTVTVAGSNSMTACGHGVGEGLFTEVPGLTFNLSQMEGRRIAILVDSPCDAALLVNAADASWHYDRDAGTYEVDADREVILDTPGDGYLDVWVGTIDGTTCDATVTLGVLADVPEIMFGSNG